MDPSTNSKSPYWIESAGGPLLLLEKSLLPRWHGYARNDATMTDYERACEIADYLGVVRVGSGYGVVLGEEPFSTTWWHCQKSGLSLIVRWVYAESEAKIIEALKSLPPDHWLTTNVELEIREGELILFDAACPFTEIDNSLTIKIPQGCYIAETLHYKPNEDTSLILHRFVPKAA